MEAETVAKEYPESFDEGAAAQAQTKTELKVGAGERIRMKFVSGPLTYRENYFEIGTKDDGTPKKIRIALPFASQLPGHKMKVKYLCEVLVLDGPAKGQNKLFAFGQQVWDDLNVIKLDHGSIRVPDIIVSRKGATKDDTKYKASAVPSTVEAKTVPLAFNLEVEVRYATKEDIDKLPPPTVGKASGEDMVSVISAAQVDLIDSLCKQKSLGMKELSKIIERKAGKAKSIDEMTVGEASGVIEALKNY